MRRKLAARNAPAPRSPKCECRVNPCDQLRTCHAVRGAKSSWASNMRNTPLRHPFSASRSAPHIPLLTSARKSESLAQRGDATNNMFRVAHGLGVTHRLPTNNGSSCSLRINQHYSVLLWCVVRWTKHIYIYEFSIMPSLVNRCHGS